EVALCQADRSRLRRVDDGGRPAGTRDRYHIRCERQQPRESDALGGSAVAISDMLKGWVAFAVVASQAATAERLVGEERDVALGTKRRFGSARSHRDRQFVLNRGEPAG